MKDVLVVVKTRTAQFCYFVANMLNMSILKKEKAKKLTRNSFNQILNQFKPAKNELCDNYIQLENYEEALKV
jgi:flagellar biosynthesis regulator FlbT